MTQYTASNKEYFFSPDTPLVSSTDPKGNITHCNQAFIETSGYSREELLGKPHNIVRHPDMPSAVFATMWKTLKAGNVWMGLVKNRRKNGDFYWVSAFVTPVYDGKKLVGYESVRVCAEPAEKQRANTAYQRIKAGKSANTLLTSARFNFNKLLPTLLPSTLLILFFSWQSNTTAVIATLIAASISSFWSLQQQASHWRSLLAISPKSFADKTVAQTYFDDAGVSAQAKLAFISEIARCRTALTRINESVSGLDDISSTSKAQVKVTQTSVEQQGLATQQIASAITEMSQAIQEVAQKIEENSHSAENVMQFVDTGTHLADESLNSIHQLSHTVDSIAVTVKELADSTQQIGQAANLISSIADQTNLLALNAAIEAARAGEQGRGFSVVADEVRALALKTRESTDQIHAVIKQLSARTSSAVDMSAQGELAAKQGVEIVENTRNALGEIKDAVGNITDMTFQMSSAVEEQSAVAEHINQQIIDIADGASDTADAAKESLRASESLESTISTFHSLIRRFRL
ncbi:methyl-accepting chemotaxis protein [Shewanella sp. 10N.7]|uniref:methyl-accepting chemotaxis protein n=1 Tax=Shewanella sp. 10N.7 TaxID=2885093 RepID=UPI001E5B7C7D|nr:PAS domain-containing methyl-accepting chemotaxis protein [Shewanella sp. 10N.7]MCC4832703.1 methyl-accepting chemotaxis protein [Shewanella sp. 10N.7]